MVKKIWSDIPLAIAIDRIISPNDSHIQNFAIEYQEKQISNFGQSIALNVVERVDGKFDLLAAFARYEAIKKMGLTPLCMIGCEPMTNAAIMMKQGFHL